MSGLRQCTALELLESWDEAVAGLDDYQGLGEFTITKTQDTITAEQIVKYTGRDVIITYVYSTTMRQNC